MHACMRGQAVNMHMPSREPHRGLRRACLRVGAGGTYAAGKAACRAEPLRAADCPEDSRVAARRPTTVSTPTGARGSRVVGCAAEARGEWKSVAGVRSDRWRAVLNTRHALHAGRALQRTGRRVAWGRHRGRCSSLALRLASSSAHGSADRLHRRGGGCTAVRRRHSRWGWRGTGGGGGVGAEPERMTPAGRGLSACLS